MTATKIWLLFAVTGHIDVAIFQSGCIVTLAAHYSSCCSGGSILHDVYFPGSLRDGRRQWLTITIFWLSSSILTFGLGRDTGRWGCLSKLRIRRPFWWRHLDLVFYFALIPQRIQMYVYAHQFNDSSWSPDLAWLEFLWQW